MAGKTGILLINLGTPDDITLKAVRRYLKEFLSDPLVIDIPAVMRWLLLNAVILPFRTPQTLHAYKSIWTEQGSPLLVYSTALKQAVAKKLGQEYVVALGMRYGNPSIAAAVDELVAAGCEKIKVVPLFPQYAMAATGSAIKQAKAVLENLPQVPEFEVIQDFYAHPEFIHALAQGIKPVLEKQKPDLVLFSYHGLPQRQIAKLIPQCQQCCASTDACPSPTQVTAKCYRAQCFETSRQVAEALSLSETQYEVCFQSRLGRIPWIEPYTDQLLVDLAARGVKRIAVACPSFVVDCLETLEEIGMRAKEQWLDLGGESLELIPCLNVNADWVNGLCQILAPALSAEVAKESCQAQ